MGKLLALLIALGGAGFAAFTMVQGVVIDFDVTSQQHPLGELSRIDAWMKEKGYESETVANSDRAPKGTKHHRYTEIYAAESGQFLTHIDVFVTDNGSAKMIVGEFPSRSTDADPSYTKSQGVCYSLWSKLSGAPPVFRDDDITPAHGAIGLRSDIKGRVVASWVKSYNDADRVYSITDWVTFELK